MNKKGSGFITTIILIVIVAGIYFFYFAPKNDLQDNLLLNQINDTLSQAINNQTNKSITNQEVNSTLPILTNNLSIICISGYSATVRDVPQSLRLEVFARDNVSYPQPEGSTELDHRINLAIGGSNDIDNLWVQFDTYPGYHEKDKLEDYLLHNVCNGNIDINYAQERIYDDWYEYYQEIYPQ